MDCIIVIIIIIINLIIIAAVGIKKDNTSWYNCNPWESERPENTKWGRIQLQVQGMCYHLNNLDYKVQRTLGYKTENHVGTMLRISSSLTSIFVVGYRYILSFYLSGLEDQGLLLQQSGKMSVKKKVYFIWSLR